MVTQTTSITDEDRTTIAALRALTPGQTVTWVDHLGGTHRGQFQLYLPDGRMTHDSEPLGSGGPGVLIDGQFYIVAEVRDIAAQPETGLESIRDLLSGDVLVLKFFEHEARAVDRLLATINTNQLTTAALEREAMVWARDTGDWGNHSPSFTVTVADGFDGPGFIARLAGVLEEVEVRRRRPVVDLEQLIQRPGEPFGPKIQLQLRLGPSAPLEASFALLSLADEFFAQLRFGYGGYSQLLKAFNRGRIDPTEEYLIIQHLHERLAALTRFYQGVAPHLALLRADSSA